MEPKGSVGNAVGKTRAGGPENTVVVATCFGSFPRLLLGLATGQTLETPEFLWSGAQNRGRSFFPDEEIKVGEESSQFPVSQRDTAGLGTRVWATGNAHGPIPLPPMPPLKPGGGLFTHIGLKFSLFIQLFACYQQSYEVLFSSRWHRIP